MYLVAMRTTELFPTLVKAVSSLPLFQFPYKSYEFFDTVHLRKEWCFLLLLFFFFPEGLILIREP